MTERIAAALQSSDLSHYERPCHSDTVRALGHVAVRRPLGVLLMECRESCAGDSPGAANRLRDLIEAVRRIVYRQADRDRLAVNALTVANLLVRELILDRCPRCSGRGFLPLAYGPEQDEDGRGVDCPTCLGTGRARRDFDARARAAGHEVYTIALRRFYEALEGRLTDAEINATHRYRKKFRGTY